MIQPPLEICARRPAQGAMPLLDSTYTEYEQMNTSQRYNVMGKYTRKCHPKAARGSEMEEGEYMHCNILD